MIRLRRAAAAARRRRGVLRLLAAGACWTAIRALFSNAGAAPAQHDAAWEAGMRRLVARDDQPAGSVASQRLRDLGSILRDRTGGSAVVTVTEFGAIADGKTDCTAAFEKALDAAGLNGTVLVPKSGGHYRLRGPVFVSNRALVGVALPELRHDPSDPATDCIVLSNPVNANLNRGPMLGNISVVGPGKGRGGDLVRVHGGDFVRIDNLLLDQAGRDGLHVEGIGDHNWTENLRCLDVKVTAAGRDSFHFRVPQRFRNVFINQTTMINCESRSASRYALALVNESGIGGGNAKISAFTWLNGELEANGTDARDVVLLQSDLVGEVESISFYDVAIEDTSNRRAGCAIGVVKRGSGRIGPLNVHNSLFYGTGAGAISNLLDVSAYDIDFMANGRPESSRLVSRLCSAYGKTGIVTGGASGAIYKAPPGSVMKIFVTGTGGNGTSHLEATVFNGTVLQTIVSSRLSATLKDGVIVLHNDGAPQAFAWYVQSFS